MSRDQLKFPFYSETEKYMEPENRRFHKPIVFDPTQRITVTKDEFLTGMNGVK